jgi:putative membrane protein
MATDLVLAILHHLAVFSLAGILAAEFVLVRPGLSRERLPALARLDGLYGGLAGVVILIGIGRVLFGLKGWEFYVHSDSFWAKMTAFLLVGLLSVPPTLAIGRWKRAAAADPSYAVPEGEIRAARRLIHAEIALFALIPVFAAMMARGVGY